MRERKFQHTFSRRHCDSSRESLYRIMHIAIIESIEAMMGVLIVVGTPDPPKDSQMTLMCLSLSGKLLS